MAWTNPITFVSGAILTAAQMNVIQDNLLAAGPIFTNEAARDAAITAPFEGQRAYLTASTVAAATGAVTAVPTGITTIYNGTAWVCVTPVGAKSTTSATTTSTGYVNTLTGDATAISVTLATGTTALVQFSSQNYNSAIARNYIAVAVSGATTVAAADADSANATTAGAGSAYTISLHRAWVITGLTAGTNTFTLNYRNNGGTSTFNFGRDLIVSGIA